MLKPLRESKKVQGAPLYFHNVIAEVEHSVGEKEHVFNGD